MQTIHHPSAFVLAEDEDHRQGRIVLESARCLRETQKAARKRLTQVSFFKGGSRGIDPCRLHFAQIQALHRPMAKSLKKFLGSLAAMVVLVPMGIVFLPLIYGMAWMLVLCLPPICAVAIVQDAKENNELGDYKKLSGNFFLAIVVLPVAIIAFTAPLRAVILAALSFFPKAMALFDEIHIPFYDLFTPVFGPLFPYWMDFYWGVISLVIIFLIALFDSIRRNKLTRQIEVLPTAKVRSVAVGLAELKGTAVSLKGQHKEAPIMRSWVASTENGITSKNRSEPFYLEDGTGRMLIDPTGISINAESDMFGIALHQAILRSFKMEGGYWESRLMPGDTVYVVGNVLINHDKAKYENDEVVVKPRKSSLLSLNFYDLFFVSNISEEALLEGLRKSVKRGWRNVLIGMLFGGWLSLFALTNIIQLEASNVDAAPEYYRLFATPTTLKREISVSELGAHPTEYFVNLLRQGEAADTDAIMRQFRELRLTSLAIPILKEQAVDIDHPGFGIANLWLSKLKALPEGMWGIEFFDDRLIHASEAVVPRLLTWFHDNRLFVYYRAYVGEGAPSENHPVRKRQVVIELVNEDSGKKFTKSFDADVGFNKVDNEEAFEFLYPGTYKLDVRVERHHRSGGYTRGSRKFTRGEIRLKE